MSDATNIRLLHIVGDSSFGGAAKIILRLAETMRSEGWHVDLLTTNAVFRQTAEENGIGTVDIDVIRREIRPLWDLSHSTSAVLAPNAFFIPLWSAWPRIGATGSFP
jgi:hypothetical protein